MYVCMYIQKRYIHKIYIKIPPLRMTMALR